MQKPDIWKLVLAHLAPSKTDPSSSDWRSYINRYIVPEVKQEIIRFFGSIDNHEAQYPGLDYSNPAHRLRLRSFPHHHQLFVVFDKLRLTESELNTLCKWHGTKRAKEEFEKKHHLKIADTTWEGVHPYCHLEPTITLREGDDVVLETQMLAGYNRMRDEDEEMGASQDGEEDVDEEESISGDGSEDELHQSVGVELNERLRANAEADAEARARGEQVTMDAEWEQWLKEAAERGIATGLPPTGLSTITPTPVPAQWGHEIPGIYTEAPHSQADSLQPHQPRSQQFDHRQQTSISMLQNMLSSHDLDVPGATSNLVPS